MDESAENVNRLNKEEANELCRRAAREIAAHPTSEAYRRGANLLGSLPRVSDEALSALLDAIASVPEEAGVLSEVPVPDLPMDADEGSSREGR
jgi:hypothetical protein